MTLSRTSSAPARVVLADSQIAVLRQLRPDDQPGVLELHQQLDERDQYFRFFGPLPPKVAELIAGMTRPLDAAHGSVGMFLGARLLGVANYAVLADLTEAEVALAVSGTSQAHGVGSLLLDHLASLARHHGVRRFVAEVLTQNARMLRMFRSCGLPCRVTYAGSETHVTLILDDIDTYRDAMGERERVADTASLRAVLRPRSLAVIGAGRSADSLEHAVLNNLINGGFTGQLYVVDPQAEEILGVASAPTVEALPVGCELAVLCVPASEVAEVADQCGQRGVRALVVLSAGFGDEQPHPEELLAAVRRYGMRIVGPNSEGVSNSDPAVRLDATFAPRPAPIGSVGLVTQSGGVGLALREQLADLGLGLSTMVCTGDKYDVSGNDMLMWWRYDDATSAVALCLESFGNPRKFGRLCQALARAKPVLALRTAANAPSTVNRDALFRQAGVIAVDTAAELVATLAALSWQPLPPGNRIAVVSNAGGTGELTSPGCARLGLQLAELDATSRATLRPLLPTATPVANPAHTAPAVTVDVFGRCVAALLADPGVDAVIAITVRTALGDPSAALAALPVGDKPVLAVRLGQPVGVAELPGTGGAARTASYADPAAALAVLGRLAEYARWRHRPTPPTTPPADVDVPGALATLRRHFHLDPAGGWLSRPETLELLSCFGIPALDSPVSDPPPPTAAHGGGLRIRVHSDGVFGPLVEFGLHRADIDLATDRIARLVPLDDADTAELVHGLRCSPALFGPHATPQLDVTAVREVLARVSLLAQLLPEVAELDLNPVVTGSEGCQVADAQIRLAPTSSPDPFLPGLRPMNDDDCTTTTSGPLPAPA